LKRQADQQQQEYQLAVFHTQRLFMV
jgi:hypothetical protein